MIDRSKLHLETHVGTEGRLAGKTVHKWVENANVQAVQGNSDRPKTTRVLVRKTEDGGQRFVTFDDLFSDNDNDEESESMHESTTEIKKPDEVKEESFDDSSFLDEDNPSSPNYKFRDTGYIAGSRKEQAANRIRLAGKNGEQLYATDIDWDEIEENPRVAKYVINKKNLFGTVDWEELEERGMDPGAGFLVNGVYASIANEPSIDNPQARHDYAIGLESIRDRLERCNTHKEVIDTLLEIRAEYNGTNLNEEEKAKYVLLAASSSALYKERMMLMDNFSKINNPLLVVSNKLAALVHNKRKRPEEIARLETEKKRLENIVHAWMKENNYEKEIEHLYNKWDDIGSQMNEITNIAKKRNENTELYRAWHILGDKFVAIVDRTSKTFSKKIDEVRTGKIIDWSWANKERKFGSRKKGNTFKLKVADKFNRVGGRDIFLDSTKELKDRFGVRDIQSGNWVLDDPKSAAFHVQRSAEALSDLADLLGIDDDKVFVNGRVAIAFGARGKRKALAHYEPIERVINITKMGGGGCLAHELFHAIDNLIPEMLGNKSSASTYATNNLSNLPQGKIHDAFSSFVNAMMDGSSVANEDVKYSARDYRSAEYNIGRSRGLDQISCCIL